MSLPRPSPVRYDCHVERRWWSPGRCVRGKCSGGTCTPSWSDWVGADALSDRKRWRLNNSVHRSSIECLTSGARVEVVASNPDSLHGLAPSLVLADECGTWPRNTTDRLYAALQTGLGKQPSSRFIALSTRPAASLEGGWFDRLLSGDMPHSYVQIHAASAADPPHQARTWKKANPSIPAMPNLLDAIRAESDAARRNSQDMPAFLALRLNAGVSDHTVDNLVLDLDVWRSCERVAECDGAYYLGVDLAGGDASDACAAYWPATGALRVFAAFGRVPSLAKRAAARSAGLLLQRMHERGELELLGERIVPPAELLARAVERWGTPRVLVADRYKQRELADAAGAVPELARTHIALRGQGFRDGGEDLRAFRRACLDGRVRAPESLLLRHALAEARVATDASGNQKLVKTTGSRYGRRRGALDDALSAAIAAVGEGCRRYSAAPPRAPRLVVVQ